MKVILIFRFLVLFFLFPFYVNAQVQAVLLDVGSWEFKERFGLFKVKQRVVEKCRKPKSVVGIISYRDCPYVVIKTNNQISVLENYTKIGDKEDLEFKIILQVKKRRGESFYGIGTQFTHFRLNDHKFDILSQEQGNGRGKQPITFFQRLVRPGLEGDASTTYAASPIVYSSRLYSFIFKNYSYGTANFKSRDYFEVSFLTKNLTYVKEVASSWKRLIQKTTHHTGRMRRLPAWIQSGAILGLMGGKKEVSRRLSKIRDSGVAISGLWLQDWVGQRQTRIGPRLIWDWQRDDRLYEDLDFGDTPILGYFNPFLSPLPNKKRDSMLEHAKRNDYLVKVQGDPHGTDNGGFYGFLVDLFNPEARQWLKDIMIREVRLNNFKGWMADFSEAMPFNAETLSTKDEQHHLYIEEWLKLNREVVNEVGPEEVTFFNRASYLKGPKYSTLSWLGDQISSWDKKDGMHSSLIGLLTGGLSGLSYNHSDIGGYVSFCMRPFVCIKRSEELLIRWMEMNAFGVVFRTHLGLRPSIAHQVDSSVKSLKAFSRWSQVFKSLKEYKRPFIEQASLTGVPVIRPLFLEFPADRETYNIDSQFMLGDSMLVAPILKKGRKKRKVYLPRGEWRSIFTNKKFISKGGYIKINAPVGKPAIFVTTHFPKDILFELRSY